MKILIIGNGGREHAITWKATQSSLIDGIFVAPGNAGTAQEPKTQNINIEATDILALIDFAKKNKIDLTIVGPETPLALGIVDDFQKNNLTIFGPTKAAAQLESSKDYAKQFMTENNIPTATFKSFTDAKEALKYIENHPYPLVIKADGLASGKGVVIAEDKTTAENTIKDMLENKSFGDASANIVIEEFLTGTELSFIVMVDGEHVLPLASSQDHKRRDDHDKGPNTGGMGAISPSKLMTPELEQKIMDRVINPTIQGLQKRGIKYTGFLYAGLMIDNNNDPYVLEFNCRLGDPETQPLMMRLQSDLIELIQAAVNQKLNETRAWWNPQTAITVVLAAGGYPHSYKKGEVIFGLEKLNGSLEQKVFHAGTKLNDDTVVTHGGRVLGVTALGSNVENARQKAYQLAEAIHWSGYFYRGDIGNY